MGNSPPQERQNLAAAMLTANAGTAQLQRPLAQRLIRRKIEFLLAVVTPARKCVQTGLHPVSANNLLLCLVFNNQVVANLVELVLVQSSVPGRGKAFS